MKFMNRQLCGELLKNKFVRCCECWNRAFVVMLKLILEMPEYVTPTDTKSDAYSSELSRWHVL